MCATNVLHNRMTKAEIEKYFFNVLTIDIYIDYEHTILTNVGLIKMKLITALKVFTNIFLTKFGKPKYATYDGIKFLTNDRSFISQINCGLSEPYAGDIKIVQRYIKEYPHKNRLYVDVGGHIGTTIIPYSRLFSFVCGYEPNKKAFQFLKHNLEYNDISNATVKNLAVLDRQCRGYIKQYSQNNSGCYRFEENHNGNIEAVSLDDEKLENVDFLKVDTEGSEFLVLKGAKKLITKNRPLILVEINGLSERNFGISSKKVSEFLRSLDYLEYDRLGHNIYFYAPTTTTNANNEHN